jgi:YDG domain
VTLAYTDKNVGAGNKTITISNAVGDANTSAGNYNITYINNTTSTIVKANATVIGSSTNVTYNGSIQTVNGFTAIGLQGADSVADLISVFSSGASGKDAGAYPNVVSGTDSNYNLNFVNGTLNITPSSLTVTALAQSKTYDATTTVPNSGAFTVTGILAGETISGVTLAYSTKDAGIGNKTIVISNAVAGANTSISNYNITYANNVASTITPATISSVSNISALNKSYDGTTNAVLSSSGAIFAGLYAGDQLSVASAVGTFDTPDIGTHKTVTISGISLGGLSAGNYHLVSTTSLAYADIQQYVASNRSALSPLSNDLITFALNQNSLSLKSIVRPEDFVLTGKMYSYDYRSLVYMLDTDIFKKRKYVMIDQGINLGR